MARGIKTMRTRLKKIIKTSKRKNAIAVKSSKTLKSSSVKSPVKRMKVSPRKKSPSKTVKKTSSRKAILRKVSVKGAGPIRKISVKKIAVGTSKKIIVRKKKTEAEKAKIKVLAKKKLKKIRANRPDFLEDKKYNEFLLSVVGEEGIEVAENVSFEEISDVELAEGMDLKANIIRKYLYALYEVGVVTYRRHRSKTGWYTYYWKLHPERIDMALNEIAGKDINYYETELRQERENQFFTCKNREECGRVIFDHALETEFRCHKCEKKLEFTDNSNIIEGLEKDLARLKS
ncbi:TPA: hypothetical protein H1011_00125 [archaeon]|uniref:Transcription factor E n=1 Tax=Candidatus Undinarchaeum marinum TaxID=2756141 RepID=A0A832V7T7_9ARCH|nr:hypothetical protein [Candidatus Undinarchaeum marinum]